MQNNPRFVFKPDWGESGRGAVVLLDHFRNNTMREIFFAVGEAVNRYNAGVGLKRIDTILVTEGYRTKDANRSIDLHSTCQAWDFTFGEKQHESAYIHLEVYIKRYLAPSLYDVVYHDAGTGKHIHVEYDPK